MNDIPVHPDQTQDNRTVPARPAPFPATLGGSAVIAIALFPARTGELPNLAVVVLYESKRPVSRAYRTVIAEAGDMASGINWRAGDGTDDTSYFEAMAVFMDRLSHRL